MRRSSVTLDGVPTAYVVRSTARGEEVVVDSGQVTGTSTLVVTLTADVHRRLTCA